jgi:hypothetical protein
MCELAGIDALWRRDWDALRLAADLTQQVRLGATVDLALLSAAPVELADRLEVTLRGGDLVEADSRAEQEAQSRNHGSHTNRCQRNAFQFMAAGAWIRPICTMASTITSTPPYVTRIVAPARARDAATPALDSIRRRGTRANRGASF